MASASVSGLVSGLDTATIISQLMQVEAQPQTMLKTRLSTEQSTVSTLQALNARFAALASKAHDLTTSRPPGRPHGDQQLHQVSATAATTAVPGGLTFTVKSTAAAHRLSFNTAKGSDVVVSPHVTLTRAARPSRWTPAPAPWTTWSPVINASRRPRSPPARSGSGDGSYRLSVVADETGAANSFTLSDDVGSPFLDQRRDRHRRQGRGDPGRRRHDPLLQQHVQRDQHRPGRQHRGRHTGGYGGHSDRRPQHGRRRRRPCRASSTAPTTSSARSTASPRRPRHARPPGRWPATRWCGTCAARCWTRSPGPRTARRWPGSGSRPTAPARSPSTARSSPRAYAADPNGVAAKLGAPSSASRAGLRGPAGGGRQGCERLHLRAC